MKKQNTRRALIMSALSLVLCISMLVGSTFAWFTDSVTSGTNKIIAGNLDIDVLSADAPDGTYTTIENKEDIFVVPAGGAKDLWEPGHTEVAYLKIVNNGTLALKYQFLVEPVNEVIGKTDEGADIKLSDILVFAATAPTETAPVAYTRETAQAAAAGSSQKLLTYSVVDQVLEAGKSAYIALVVSMPESVGNEANYRNNAIPSIDFAVTAVATQAMKENDSFNNDYDENAAYPVINIEPAGGAVETEIVAPNTGISVVVPAGVPEGNYTVQVDNKNTDTDVQGQTTVAFELELLKDGEEVEPVPNVKYPVKVYIGSELVIAAVTHNGVAITDYTYDDATGYISFQTDSFSPFEVIYMQISDDATGKVVGADGKVSYCTTLNEAFAAVNGATTITARGDMVLTETALLDQDAEVVLDLKGFTLSGNVETLLKLTAGKITIQNGTIRNVHDAATTTKYSIYMDGDAVAEIKDVTIETTGVGIHMTGNARITELDADISSYVTVNGSCAFHAVEMLGNAKIDLISGGTYKSYLAESMFEAKRASQTVSYEASWTVHLNSANAYIGEIRGGTFIGTMDTANNGTPIHVNSGTVDLISGGYFGFTELSFQHPAYMLFTFTNNGGKINKITGGTFEEGCKPVNIPRYTGYGCDFLNIVAASGCKVEATGETVVRGAQWSKSVNEYNIQIVRVVPQ